jgi:hypothetical protein
MAPDLMKYLIGRGTGQTSDASLPALQFGANDPIIKNQTDAFRAEQERGVRSGLSALAEKAGSGANLNAETRSGYEKAGQATSAFEAQLMQHELNARRQEIESALSGAMGFLTNEQQMMLQEELAQLQLAQQESQFGRGLAEQGFEFGTQAQLRGMGL